MDRIQFNTGRKYSIEGQRIVAILTDGILYFNDLDRNVSGSFEVPEWDEWFALTETQVMATYDGGYFQHIESGVETFVAGQMLKIADILTWDWEMPVADPIKEYVKKNAEPLGCWYKIAGFGYVDADCSDSEWQTAAMVLASKDIASQAAFMAETGEIDHDALQVTLDIIKHIKEAF